MKNTVKGIFLSAVVLTLMLSGCATKGQLNEVRELARQANSDAAAASQTAQNAEDKADQAIQIADDANTKIDNMFKKAMQK